MGSPGGPGGGPRVPGGGSWKSCKSWRSWGWSWRSWGWSWNSWGGPGCPGSGAGGGLEHLHEFLQKNLHENLQKHLPENIFFWTPSRKTCSENIFEPQNNRNLHYNLAAVGGSKIFDGSKIFSNQVFVRVFWGHENIFPKGAFEHIFAPNWGHHIGRALGSPRLALLGLERRGIKITLWPKDPKQRELRTT